MDRREGRKAYLLITFDLDAQKVVGTDEIVGPFKSYKVSVDWRQLCKVVKRQDDPPDPPWRRMAFEDEEDYPQKRPWKRGEGDDVERPPDV